MKKEDIIARGGEAAWEKHLAQCRGYYKAHREQEKARVKKWKEEHREQAKAAVKKWQEEHQEQVIANHQEGNRKGGRSYAKHLEYTQTGIPGERHKIRTKHGREWKRYKNIIAPESQIHHEWVPKTAKYRGVALVEKDQHMHGIVDVIEILEGKITLLTEEEVRKGGN